VASKLTFAADEKAPADAKAAPDAKPASDAKPEPFVVRVRAGSTQTLKDSKGNKWLGDTMTKDGGFEGGSTIERPDIKIENTKDQDIYRAEHYSMDSFWWKVPNGKYKVKLHFCETYEGIGGPGDRVFAFKVQGKEFKDFDVYKITGKSQKAHVETVDAEVTDGKLKITFTPKVENPQINGIEILDASIPDEKPTDDKASAAPKAATP